MPVDGTIQLAYQDTAWFNDPLNAEIILKEGQHVYLSDGADEFLSAYVVGDGITELQNLPWKGLIIGVQSVTGSNVDNTDPVNPVVNPLGLIKIIDLNGELFTDLATAKSYIRTFIDHSTYPITQESYQDGVYYFTTPINTEAMLLGGFMQNSSASFVDELGLICHFNQAAFFINIGNHIFGADMIFEGQSFYGTTGNTVFKKDVYFFIYPSFPHFENATGTYFFNNNLTLDASEQFALNSNAKFIFSQNIGPTEGANYVGFFSGSTSTIFASASKYSSNAGGIQGDLQTAISNGCNVQFDGINLATVNDLTRNNLGLYEMFITTGDQTTTSNIASNITGLVSQTLQANTRYYFEGIIMIGCNNTGGVKIQATLPALSSIAINLEGASSSATGRTFSRLIASGALSSGNFCSVNSSYYYIKVAGEVSIGATPGTVQFGFASGTNLQTSTIHQLGTCINYKKLN